MKRSLSAVIFCGSHQFADATISKIESEFALTCEVAASSNSLAAILALRPWDVVIADYSHWTVSPPEILQQLVHQDSCPPVIVVAN